MTAAHDLLPLALFRNDAPLVIDLVYAQPTHEDNHFPHLYHPQAHMLVHRRLLPVIILAARLLHQATGWHLKINDCFRPVEAQAKMAAYGYPPELVMPPGMGGHPRGMAIDVEPVNAEGDSIPMGTPFDFFAQDLDQNPASRNWQDFGPPAMSAQIIANRAALDQAMFTAARLCGEELIGFPTEWWDYRFPAAVANTYPAISDADLPASLKMMTAPEGYAADETYQWEGQRQHILDSLQKIMP